MYLTLGALDSLNHLFHIVTPQGETLHYCYRPHLLIKQLSHQDAVEGVKVGMRTQVVPLQRLSVNHMLHGSLSHPVNNHQKPPFTEHQCQGLHMHYLI